jgi:hypothetical protein
MLPWGSFLTCCRFLTFFLGSRWVGAGAEVLAAVPEELFLAMTVAPKKSVADRKPDYRDSHQINPAFPE